MKQMYRWVKQDLIELRGKERAMLILALIFNPLTLYIYVVVYIIWNVER